MKSIHQILEVSGNLVDKSAEMAENDPHGTIITIVSVSVVFAALILLYFAYTLIGKIASSKMVQAHEEPSDNTAATDPASEQKEEEDGHDKESYVITIQRDRTKIVPYAPIMQQASGTMHSEQEHDVATAVSSKGKNVTAPLPGVILAVKVKAGDHIRAGQTVAVLEAMKMENEIQAEHDGTVQSVNVEKGESVLEGTIIVTIC